MGLGRVFDYPQVVAASNLDDRVHVGRLPVKVHRDDGPGPGCNGRFDPGAVKVECSPVRFHSYRRCTGVGYRQPGGDVGVGRDNHLVAGTDIHGPQDQVQRFQTVSDTDALLRVAVVGELSFKGIHLAAEYEPARLHHPVVGLVQFRRQFEVGGLQVKKGNLHAICPSPVV